MIRLKPTERRCIRLQEYQQLEIMSFKAWPALNETERGGCFFRLSEGYTKRANSANPVLHDMKNPGLLIDSCISVYRNAGLTPVFKIIDTEKYTKLDARLEALGWSKIDPTAVMTAELEPAGQAAAAEEDVNIIVEDRITSGWIENYYRVSGIKPEHKDIAGKMLREIDAPVIAVSVSLSAADGRTAEPAGIAACGYGHISGDAVGLFDITVAPAYRNKGLGRLLVRSIMNKAADAGCSRAYLQVVEENAPAVNLYRSEGFSEVYGYWYRIEAGK